jgi:bacterioferritin-associated ferredoxin
MALLCSCHLVSDREVAALVERGHDTVDAVGDACGAGSSCGGCVESIEAVVERLCGTLARSTAA